MVLYGTLDSDAYIAVKVSYVFKSIFILTSADTVTLDFCNILFTYSTACLHDSCVFGLSLVMDMLRT